MSEMTLDIRLDEGARLPCAKAGNHGWDKDSMLKPSESTNTHACCWAQKHTDLDSNMHTKHETSQGCGASTNLTKLLSFIIFFMEYAKEIVTARGSPSGTAT